MLEQEDSIYYQGLEFVITHLSNIVTERKNEYLFQLFNDLAVKKRYGGLL